MKEKFSWDGEKIKQVRIEEEKKFTPKDILNGLAHVRKQIYDLKNSEIQLNKQLVTAKGNIRSAGVHEAELKKLEDKCIELQKAKLIEIIGKIKVECQGRALKTATETIEQDPSAYTKEQKERLPYLNYQKFLATDIKVGEKISSQIITKYLYEEPIFDDPFKI